MKTLEEKLLFLFKIAKRNKCYKLLGGVDLDTCKLVYQTDTGCVTLHQKGEIVVMILNLDRFISDCPNRYGHFLYSLSRETIDFFPQSEHKTPTQLLYYFVFDENGEPRYFDNIVDERIDALYSHFSHQTLYENT